MNRRLAWVAALLIGAAGPAIADGLYDRCITQSDGSYPAWAGCATAMLDRADARLNAAWKALLPLVDPGSLAALQSEQRAWIAYKEKSCLFYTTGAYGRDGEVVSYPICRAKVIDARTADLQALQAELKVR